MDKIIKENNELPSWDLSDLYNSTKSPKLKSDIRKLDQLTSNFNKTYKGKVRNLNNKKIFTLISDLEIIERLNGRLISFAYLNYCEEVNNEEKNKFLSFIQEKLTKFESRMLFLSLEIKFLLLPL